MPDVIVCTVIVPSEKNDVVHMLFYPFTRAYMGSEFGYVRSARDW